MSGGCHSSKTPESGILQKDSHLKKLNYRSNLTNFSGPGTPKLVTHSVISRTMANHRRALSVRSKTSLEGKGKRRMNRAHSEELDAEKIKFKNVDFMGKRQPESSAKSNIGLVHVIRVVLEVWSGKKSFSRHFDHPLIPGI